MSGELNLLRVVVTRSSQQSLPLIESIENAGGTAISLPMLEIIDEPVDDLITALTDDSVEWLVATSTNGARGLTTAAHDLPRPKVAVVGPSTRRWFEEAGWTVDLMPSRADSATLVSEFPEAEPGSGRVVVAQGDLARPTVEAGLAELGWSVQPVVVYRNVMPALDPSAMARAVEADVIVFASPSAARRYVEHVGTSPAVAVCIGPVTAAEVDRLGFEVIEAEGATDADLRSALAAFAER